MRPPAAGWHVRVRGRDEALVAFTAAPTVQQAFERHYHPQQQTELIARRCPPPVDSVWQALEEHQDIAIEPLVMGKGGFQVSCRATGREAPAS